MTNLQQNIGRKILVNKSQNEKFEKLKKLKAARNIGIVYAVNEIDNNLKNKIIHYFEAEGNLPSKKFTNDYFEMEEHGFLRKEYKNLLHQSVYHTGSISTLYKCE